MSLPPKYESVHSELLSLTYGAIAAQVIRDYEDPREVNIQLEQMGYNIGIRLVDEFCAKNRAVKCRTFRETMETVAGGAFRMFLGVPAVLEAWAADGTSCTLRLPDNPLADFVELPPAYSELRYSNILCGIIRGALEMVRSFSRRRSAGRARRACGRRRRRRERARGCCLCGRDAAARRLL